MPDSQTWLAFDLGAESGRAFTGCLQNRVITIREIHRFLNEPVEYGGALHWDAPHLWNEMKRALSRTETRLAGIGVDSWGVDYALLDKSGELLRNPYHYRDSRNPAAMTEVLDRIPREHIYRQTGIQFMPINTINQLQAAMGRAPEMLRTARQLLMIPDLFHYWLTGRAVCEYTDATTTQLVNPTTRCWSMELIRALGLPEHIFGEIVEPGTIIGSLLGGIGPAAHSGTPVIAPASHDTGSAVASITTRDDTAFISSGTWSLMGVELDAPLITGEGLRLNFTNEGGVCGTTRLLRNVMGLWMIQSCRHYWAAAGQEYDYSSLMEQAMQSAPFNALVDPDDASFLNPGSMPGAIDGFCRRTGQPLPATPGAYTRAILESLALKYRLVLAGIEEMTGRTIRQVRVLGGGSKNKALNQFTADATGCRVIAGPAEAAVLGNLGIQMLATGAASSLSEMRAMIDRSFPTEVYEPSSFDLWQRHFERFEQYCEFTYA
jgi:rhamnulokinase